MTTDLAKKHPIALFFLGFYFYWVYRTINVVIDFNRIPAENDGIKFLSAQGSIYWTVSITVLGIAGALFMIRGLIISKSDRRFYYWALGLIIVPLIAIYII